MYVAQFISTQGTFYPLFIYYIMDFFFIYIIDCTKEICIGLTFRNIPLSSLGAERIIVCVVGY